MEKTRLEDREKPVKNEDLWRRLDEGLRHDVSWHWVMGHAGHAENERAGRAGAHRHEGSALGYAAFASPSSSITALPSA